MFSFATISSFRDQENIERYKFLTLLKSLLIFKTLYETGTATKTAGIWALPGLASVDLLAQLEENNGIPLFMRHKKSGLDPLLPEADELLVRFWFAEQPEEHEDSIVALREFLALRAYGIASARALGFAYVPKNHRPHSCVDTPNLQRLPCRHQLPQPEVVRAVERVISIVGFVDSAE